MKPRTWEILSIFPNFINRVAGSASLASIALLLYFILKQTTQDTKYTDFKVTPGRSSNFCEILSGYSRLRYLPSIL